jgi:hypothetical protein
VFCGWDWGSTHHGVCVIDGSGTIVKHWLVQHTHDDLVSWKVEAPRNWVGHAVASSLMAAQ